MTALNWIWILWFSVLCCFALHFVLHRIRRIRVHAVHRGSVHFPNRPFLCADLILERKPLAHGATAAHPDWCTDCGWEDGHSIDCPRVTGETCPNCGKPKRTQYVCHYCKFAGFVIVLDFPSKRPWRAFSWNRHTHHSVIEIPLSREESDRLIALSREEEEERNREA